MAKKKYVKKLISSNLADQIDIIQKNLNDEFGINISSVKASRVVAWKAQKQKLLLDDKKLIKLLEGH